VAGLVEVPIQVSSEVARPNDVPRHGSRRLVRLLPTPFGSRPAIWTSPYTYMEVFPPDPTPARARSCVVLVSPGTPGSPPETVPIRIPDDAIEKFPLVPVEW
jgi:hypothetical protein